MMLDELRNLFLRALKCNDSITTIILIDEWNKAVKQVQDVFDNITSKVSKPIKTNADEIRQMSNEGLAELCSEGGCPVSPCPHLEDEIRCKKCWLDWLKQEVESDG